MEYNKLCPLLMAGCHDIGLECKGELCAWYIRGCCAMVDIADSLTHIAINTIEQE